MRWFGIFIDIANGINLHPSPSIDNFPTVSGSKSACEVAKFFQPINSIDVPLEVSFHEDRLFLVKR